MTSIKNCFKLVELSDEKKSNLLVVVSAKLISIERSRENRLLLIQYYHRRKPDQTVVMYARWLYQFKTVFLSLKVQ